MSYESEYPECPYCQTPVITDDSERAVMVNADWMHRSCADQLRQEAAEAAADMMREDDDE